MKINSETNSCNLPSKDDLNGVNQQLSDNTENLGLGGIIQNIVDSAYFAIMNISTIGFEKTPQAFFILHDT
jgi:hypothetical protein